MAKYVKDARLDNILTVREVCNILNYHEIPCNDKAMRDLVRQAREERTVKNILRKWCRYAVAFFPALLHTMMQQLNINGKYSQGGIISGRKDM